MSTELWDQCAQVISRVEAEVAVSATKAKSIRTIADFIVNELVDQVSGIQGARASIESANHCSVLAATGDVAGSPQITELSAGDDRHKCKLETWCSSAETPDALRQTAGALAELYQTAIDRFTLQLLHTSLAQLAAESSAERRITIIAKLIADSSDSQRVSLVSRPRGRLLAISLSEDIDHRAKLVVALERLALSIAKGSLSREVLRPLDELDSQSVNLEHARAGGIATAVSAAALTDDCVVIAESFSDQTPQAMSIPDPVRDLAKTQLSSDEAQHRRSLVGRFRSVAGNRSGQLGMAALVLLLSGLVLWPMPIRVAASGRLIPVIDQRVYARTDAELVQLHCRPGDRVESGQLLCELSSMPWASQQAKLEGELLTAKEQLQVVISARGQSSSETVQWQRPVVEARIESIEQQLELLNARAAALKVQSPIGGVVEFLLDDEPSATPESRPVKIGQPILRVVDLDAGYNVEIDLPDSQIGYVLSALRSGEDSSLPCSYRIRSSPNAHRTGALTEVDPSTSVNDGGQLIVHATVEPEELTPDWKPEAGVVAWVRCENSSLGFVMFRRVIETIKLWGW